MRRAIIIDTDPGTDDAVAILLALAATEALSVEALTVVAGNLPLDVTVRNARAICALAGRSDVPVYAGCARPLGRPLVTAAHIHGEGGLGGLILPPPAGAVQGAHAVDFLTAALTAAAPRSITLCTLGPLTNIALALVKAPAIAAAISEIVMMGGASRALGNVTPAAEFNIYVDPLAAALVLESGIAVTMMPLDVTHQVRVGDVQVERFRNLGNHCGAAAAALLTPRAEARQSRPASGMPLHDPCVIAYLLQPELFSGHEVNVAVETASPLTLGMTVVDWRGCSGRPANARVVDRVDAAGFWDLLADRIARLP